MSISTTSDDLFRDTKMRKRKRNGNGDYGSYIDEDTGEVTTVQTTKQAKRAHQKSGKWYKEPSEAELRAWEREEQRQALADRAAKREENKKANAMKKAEKEKKEEELKRQMFQSGKITFTQTLAKKDEDQKNLHSWFGGRPKTLKSNTITTSTTGEIEDKNKKGQSQDKDKVFDATGHVSTSNTIEDGQTCLEQVRKLSQESSHDFDDDEVDLKDFCNCESISTCSKHRTFVVDQASEITTMDLAMDPLNDSNFEVLEDDSAEMIIPDQVSDQKSTNHFKVPPLPGHAQTSPPRLPLSPMSPSDVNVRNLQTTIKVSSFKSRLEIASAAETSRTQSVRDILLGICTQDLVDDIDDFNKENDELNLEIQTYNPVSPIKSVKNSSLPRSNSFAKVGSNLAKASQSFDSTTESVDYDSIFFEIDAAGPGGDGNNDNSDNDDFDDCGLDDATLLSLPPATQIVSSAYKSRSSTGSTPVSNLAPTKRGYRPFIKNDSFALEGLEDDDLLAGFKEYERSQRGIVSTSDLVSKKKRVLPWDRPSWGTDLSSRGRYSGGVRPNDNNDDNETNDSDVEIATGTQDTEVISNFG